jgi:ArsR family transcriptional regulator
MSLPLDDYATMFKALGDPLRLRLLNMLPSGEDKRAFCVCDLARKLGVSQPCLSHHLNILKTAGLVGFEKDGCSVFYFVDQPELFEKLRNFQASLEDR